MGFGDFVEEGETSADEIVDGVEEGVGGDVAVVVLSVGAEGRERFVFCEVFYWEDFQAGALDFEPFPDLEGVT